MFEGVILSVDSFVAVGLEMFLKEQESNKKEKSQWRCPTIGHSMRQQEALVSKVFGLPQHVGILCMHAWRKKN